MDALFELATVLQLILCVIVIIGIAIALAVTHFPALFRIPLCLLAIGTVLYSAGLFESRWLIVKTGQIVESFGIAGMVLGLVYLSITSPRFHKHP